MLIQDTRFRNIKKITANKLMIGRIARINGHVRLYSILPTFYICA
jgi:hypothetical protein